MENLGNRYSQHSFAQIPDVKMARSRFDRSYTVKDTMNFDELTPIMVDEVIPGDTYNVSVNAFARLATQIHPIMDNLYMNFFFFFVPNRILWVNWEKLNGAQDNPGDSIAFSCPILTLGAAFTVGSIFDHFGLPTDVANVPVLNTLPLRAYNKIWNDWFRDQNTQNKVLENTDDGPDAQADYTILKRGKTADYFTTAQISPQRGNAVTLSIGTTADVWGSASAIPTAVTDNHSPIMAAYLARGGANGNWQGVPGLQEVAGSAPAAVSSVSGSTAMGYDGAVTGSGNTTNNMQDLVFLNKSLSQTYRGTAVAPFQADLTTATAITVNALRLAIMTQSLLELDQRGGTRYVEILRNHFGVVSPDFRLQRPEFLGSGEIKINSHPVAQTAITSGTNAQGQLAGFATAMATGNNIGFSKSFVEHGYIIGLCSARADITYQQGLERMWSKSTRYDFFWPKLQQLGEQSVLNQEIYCAGNGAAGDTNVFGYQERYAEYRYKPSQIHGKFRSTYATTIDVWHQAEKFNSLPALNSTFIQSNTPITRAIAVSGEPPLICDFWFKMQCARPMMTYSVPATLGRF